MTAGLEDLHRALLDAGLPRKLVAALQSQVAPSDRLLEIVEGDVKATVSSYPAGAYTIFIFEKLLHGPLAVEAADAVIAAGVLNIVSATLFTQSESPLVAGAANKCLFAISTMIEALRARIDEGRRGRRPSSGANARRGEAPRSRTR